MLLTFYYLVFNLSYVLATIVERVVDTQGGYGVTTDVCPTDTRQCGSYCCPSGQDCFEDDSNAFSPANTGCCPIGPNNCLPGLALSPHCADSTWELWNVTSEGEYGANLCCLPGATGAQDGNCYSSGAPLPPGISKAVQVSQSGSTANSVTETSQTTSNTPTSAQPSTTQSSTQPSNTAAAGKTTTASATTASKTSGGNANSRNYAVGFGIACLLAAVFL